MLALSFSGFDPIPDVRGTAASRCPIEEAKKWIAVTGKLEFVNDWEKTLSGGVFSLDWQLTLSPMT